MTGRVIAVLLAGAAVACGAPAPADIDTRAVVARLAADELEGRLTGSAGSRLAADYLVEQLDAIGAEPLPGQAEYRLAFAFTSGVSDTGTTLEVSAPEAEATIWGAGDVRGLAFSDAASVSGPLIFAGYGLSVPETDGFSYDSYATLDVTDKIVLVLRYFPEDAEGDVRAMLSRNSAPRFKATAARARGAKGLIVVTGPRSPNAGELAALTFDSAMGDAGIVAATVTGALGEAFMQGVWESLEDVQASLDTANPHVTGFDLPFSVSLDVKLEREEGTGYNVIGYLPPAVAPAAEVAEPYVMLGAHYDHLGHGRGGDSLARAEESGEIHNGADDNASGVAAVLSAGAQLAQHADRSRGVVLAFWSGEELGLLGSADFVDQAPVPMDEIAAYLNFDMVGRLRDNTLTVQAVGSSTIWTELVEELNEPIGFDLQFVADPYLPTDVTSLNAAEVPSLAFFTGSHEDYHRPTDDADTVNYTDLDRIAALGASVAARLASRTDPPDFIRVERSVQRAGQATMRVFTGTIPNYAQEADGLLLSGVIAGGPADAAGLMGGDIIVELAGHTIRDIYDYTYALDLLKVGEPAMVVVNRDGERVEMELVPEARE